MVCHDPENLGDQSAFNWQLSSKVKDFVHKLLRDRHSVSQIMAKHIQVVKDAIGNGHKLHQDLFLHEADVHNITTKLAKETYMLDKSDAKSVKL